MSACSTPLDGKDIVSPQATNNIGLGLDAMFTKQTVSHFPSDLHVENSVLLVEPPSQEADDLVLLHHVRMGIRDEVDVGVDLSGIRTRRGIHVGAAKRRTLVTK